MAHEFDFLKTLPIDSNIALLEVPTTIGTLRYVTLNTWKTADLYHVNIGIIDKAERISQGEFFDVRCFLGLNFLQVENGIVSVGHDDAADIATWRVMPDAELLLYHYAVSDYPADTASDDWDARAIRFVESLGTTAKLVDYKRVSGGEVQGLRFKG